MYIEKAYMITYAVAVFLFVMVFIFYLAVGCFMYTLGQIFGLFISIENLEKRWMRIVARVVVISTFPISMLLFSIYYAFKELSK